MRILRYLKNAPGKEILFAKNVDHQSIEVYMDLPLGCMVSEGVQIEEVIIWVEAIPESMVWKVHKVNESFWLSSN